MCNAKTCFVYHAGVRSVALRPTLRPTWLFLLAVLLTAVAHSGCATAPMAPPDYHYTQDWFVGKISWPDLLDGYRDKPNVRYLEIGVFEGRSLFWMLDHILTGRGASATAVDLFEPDHEETFLANLRHSGKADHVHILKGRSDIVLHTLPIRSFDIVFVDGSHAARDVLTDIVQGWLLLVDGGLMIMDDYGNEKPRGEFDSLPRVPDELKPRVAIDAFLTAFRGELDVVQRDFQLVVRKRVPACADWVCSGGQNWFYDWAQRRLFRRSTQQPIPLTEEQRTEMESILTTLPFGATVPEPSQECLAKPACKSAIELLTGP
jgi:hypothetical protein